MAGVGEEPERRPPDERERQSTPPAAGLCNSCAHQQLVHTTRGSVFSLCQRSRTEPERYPRYPRLPVTECDGWERH